jgi:hypothetical protein
MIEIIARKIFLIYFIFSIIFVPFFSYFTFQNEKERITFIYSSCVSKQLDVAISLLDLTVLKDLYNSNNTHFIEPELRIIKDKLKAKYLFIYEIVSTNEGRYLADGSVGEDYSPPGTVEQWSVHQPFDILDGQVKVNPLFNEAHWGMLSGAYSKLFGSVGIGLEYDVTFISDLINIAFWERMRGLVISITSCCFFLYIFSIYFVKSYIKRKFNNSK